MRGFIPYSLKVKKLIFQEFQDVRLQLNFVPWDTTIAEFL
jgi:hypothetical protein